MGDYDDDPPPPVRPLQGRSKLVVGSFGVLIAVYFASLVAMMGQISLLGRAAGGATISPIEAADNDARIQLISSVQSLFVIVTAIVFLVWFHRASNNLAAFGRPVPFGKWGAVWSFIIPIISLFRPYQVMSAIWTGSPGLDGVPTSGLAAGWWGGYVVMSVLGVIARFSFTSARHDVTALRDASVMQAVHDVVAIATASLAIVLVLRITRRQSAAMSEEIAAAFD